MIAAGRYGVRHRRLVCRGTLRRALQAGAIAASLAGCALAPEPRDQRAERLLIAAGFTAYAADAPEIRAKLDRLAPGKITRVERSGEPRYVYLDPAVCRCAYVGTPRQYRTYQTLAWQEKLSEDAPVVTEASDPRSSGFFHGAVAPEAPD